VGEDDLGAGARRDSGGSCAGSASERLNQTQIVPAGAPGRKIKCKPQCRACPQPQRACCRDAAKPYAQSEASTAQAVATAPRDRLARVLSASVSAVRARAQSRLTWVRCAAPADGRITHEDLDAVLVPTVGAGCTGRHGNNGIGRRHRPAPQDRGENADAAPHPHFAYVEEADLTSLKTCAHQRDQAQYQPKLTMLPF
jgi:pyruvate/2-oxoglutarate dehydrogenase complex dihydrolipoamide acyltransferase (E2) component